MDNYKTYYRIFLLIINCQLFIVNCFVVPGRVELPTSTLSVQRSNQLSYRTGILCSEVTVPLFFFPFRGQGLFYITNNIMQYSECEFLVYTTFLLKSDYNLSLTIIQDNISPERRCSSRTFRYGYLVTTQPQLPILPQDAPCGYVLQVPSASMA